MLTVSRAFCGMALAVILGGCSAPMTAGSAGGSGSLGCLFPPQAKPMPATTVRQTGRLFDLAIQGDGFFIVRDPVAGENRYTRFGQFRQTSEGNLVTTDGRQMIEPQITIPSDALAVRITPDGFVKVKQPESPYGGPREPDGFQAVGQIQLARITNPAALQEVRPLLYRLTCEVNNLVVGSPTQGGFGSLLVGSLEEPITAGGSDTAAKPN